MTKAAEDKIDFGIMLHPFHQEIDPNHIGMAIREWRDEGPHLTVVPVKKRHADFFRKLADELDALPS